MRWHLYSMALVVAMGGAVALAQTQQPSTSDQGKMPAASASSVQSDIQSALQKDPSLASANINVQVSDQGVDLTGTAPTKDAKDKAEQIATAHAGGLPVKNHIKVAGSTESPR
jgi:osmotically-inducible protein OsmY